MSGIDFVSDLGNAVLPYKYVHGFDTNKYMSMWATKLIEVPSRLACAIILLDRLNWHLAIAGDAMNLTATIAQNSVSDAVKLPPGARY